MKPWFLAGLAMFLVNVQGVRAQDSIDPQYLQLLEDVVNINTDSNNVEGLTRLRGVLIPQFEALGLVVSHHPLSDGRETLSFETSGARPTIVLIGHLDTVFPTSSPFQHLSRQEDRLTGPGVIDMKGGVVLMLETLAQLKQSGHLDNVRVVLNDDEEIGSVRSKPVLQQLSQGLAYGLVFEPGLEDGAYVSSQSGIRWVKLTSTGKASHAGLEPENGIDACLDLAIKVQKIAALARPEQGLLINPGVIEGGTKPNVVCDKASVTIDVRFQQMEDWENTAAALDKISGHSDIYNQTLKQGTHSEWVKLAEMPVLPATGSRVVVALGQEIAKSLGQTFKARAVGYGSDGNNIASGDIQILVGLGPYGGGMHSEKEFMQLSSYRERLLFATALIRKLNPATRITP